MSEIDDLHAELNFDTWKPELQKIAGVWSTLEKLQQKATDPRGVSAYRNYLQRCVNNLEANDVELSAEVAETKVNEWLVLYKTRVIELTDRVAGRGANSVEDWCAQWLPDAHAAYVTALVAVTGKATKRTFEALFTATAAMFDQFESAI